MYTGNAGDSRCVACVDGEANALSSDHKPGDERERKRIEGAGGFVEFNRVNGNLALSRALGDFSFKANDGLEAEDQVGAMREGVFMREIHRLYSRYCLST